MNSAEILTDAFGRVREAVHEAVAGLTENTLGHRIETGTNSLSWLVWHLTRVQDEHLTELIGGGSVWAGDGWFERFALPIDRAATGYGDTPKDVARIVAPADLLTGYHDAVHARTTGFLGSITDRDLATVVDDSWDPPVTMGVRLVSVLADDLQHAGQANYLRGVLNRSPSTEREPTGRY